MFKMTLQCNTLWRSNCDKRHLAL